MARSQSQGLRKSGHRVDRSEQHGRWRETSQVQKPNRPAKKTHQKRQQSNIRGIGRNMKSSMPQVKGDEKHQGAGADDGQFYVTHKHMQEDVD